MKSDMVVFVTGGDKGIGRSLVERMSEQSKTVIFTYNKNKKSADEIMALSQNIVALQCDLNNTKRISEVADFVLAQFDRIDILINNAGYECDSLFSKMTEEQWDDVININLKSIYHFAHRFVPKMIESNWGRIVNLTSIAAYTGAFGKSNYASAKAGIVGFTKSLAMELGGKGITVNAIAPGAIETDMLMRIPEKYRAKILENIPTHKFGKPSDVADLAEFLVSNKATYINGQTIHINGGSYSI